jgi:hypothetical protein
MGGRTGDKTALLRHLYIKCIILPRQARDKHRENSKKEAVLSQFTRFFAAGFKADQLTTFALVRRKRRFWRHVILQTKYLPRQAWDKHTKS